MNAIAPRPVAPNRKFFSREAPGVYLEDEFNLPRRRSFRTGVPVFIGLMKTAKPEMKPVPHMLSLWSQFEPHMGALYEKCALAYAVRGFFENGGVRCYVLVLPDESFASLQNALDVAAERHTIDLVCLTDAGKDRAEAFEKQQLVVSHCESLGDRFAILDSWLGDEKEGVAEQWSAIDGNNGAIYYPWIGIRGFDGNPVLAPPCGHVAGVYARTDEAVGVHKAPANEVLEGVIDLERKISNTQQDFLNPRRVNCLRSFPGRGIRVWGARTLGGHDQWTYVNVRRLFLTAVRWINWHMGVVVFEPNDARLWARIERDLNGYFLEQYQKGALKGRSPQEAYYVRCNAETNPPELRELGQVITEIGLAPASPYEFVVVRLIHGASGVSISGPIRPNKTYKEQEEFMPTGDRKDPFRSFNFKLEIDGISRNGFRECSGLDSTTAPVDYREGFPVTGNIVKKLTGLNSNGTLTLKWGTTDDHSLWDWRDKVIQGKTERKNGSIILMDEAGEEKKRWNFVAGWPTKWTGPTFNATANEVAIETLEIVTEGVKPA